jgi:hypoxanthine phosphoribosyltransferase
VRIDLDLKQDIEGTHVLIVEDIIDTGLTLSHLLELLSLRKPASLNICSMLRKPTQAKVKVDAKYVGFDIPPKFVVGVGLDWSEKLRELPYIGVLKEEMYKH